MSKLRISVPVLALGMVLLAAGESLAQFRGVSIGVGVGRGGFYPGYYGLSYPGYPYPYYPYRSGVSIGLTYAPGYYGYYDYPRYGYSYPPGALNYYYSAAPQTYVVPPPEEVAYTDADVLFNVRVPSDALVWVNGGQTTKTGTQREFVSSGLTPGRWYTYEIRARWTQKGEVVDKVKRVKVQGGERRTVDFRMPETE